MRVEVVVRTQFANCVGPQICLPGLWQHLVATERHLWLNLSNIKRKYKNFLMDAPFFPLTSSTMQLNRLSRDFRNQLHKQLHSRSSSPAILISPGLLSGSSPKHLSRAWLFVLPQLNNGDTGSALNHSLRSVKRVWGPLLLFYESCGEAVLTPEVSGLWGLSVGISAKYISLGPADYRKRVSNTVQVSPSQVLGVLSTEVAPQQVLVMEKEVKALLEKGAIEYVPHSNRETGFYSRFFIVPKKDGGLCPILDLRVLNDDPHPAQVQNVNFKANRATDQIWGMVCHDRSQGCIHPHIHPSMSQEVPEVCFLGQSILILGSSVRPSIITPHFHEIRRCSPGASSASGYSHYELHRRLVDSSSVASVGSAASRCRSGPHERVGVMAKRQKECDESSCQLTGFGRETRTVPLNGGVWRAQVHRDRSLHLGNARVPPPTRVVRTEETDKRLMAGKGAIHNFVSTSCTSRKKGTGAELGCEPHPAPRNQSSSREGSGQGGLLTYSPILTAARASMAVSSGSGAAVATTPEGGSPTAPSS